MTDHVLPESQIPQASAGIIARPRLLDKLRAATSHRLTLICAPPGYGKTTLASQFAMQSGLPVAWHAIEERQRDVPNLHEQALAALTPHVPEVADLSSGRGVAAGELAAALADTLNEVLDGELLYVLDDTQLLQGSPAAEAWLSAFIERAPTRCHILIASRTLPDLPLTELIARGDVLAIGQDELRFLPEEIAVLADAVTISQPEGSDGATVSSFEATQLAERLEGWPAGTVLALQPLPAALAPLLRSAAGPGRTGPEALFYALAGSMLAAQPPGLRDFLLTASAISPFTPELCSTVLEIPNSAFWIAEALNRNLFLSRGPGGLTFHKLFRQFLQQKLKDDRPALFVELHTRAAGWFAINERLDEAFEHFELAGMLDEAAGVAERVAHAYFAQGKVETLLHWGKQLQQAHTPVPRLMFACAMIHQERGDYEIATAELGKAEVAFATRGDTDGLREVQLLRAMIALQRGDLDTVAALATPLLDLSANGTGVNNNNVAGRALKVLGVMALHKGDVDGAIAQLSAAVPLHRENGDAYALANVLQDLGVAYWRLGDLDQASAYLQDVVATRQELGSASALALALNNLGFLYHLSGHYELALETLEEGLSASNRVPQRRNEAYLLASLADLRRDQGAHDEALRLYHKALEVIGTAEPALRAAILIGSSQLWRWQNELPEAIRLADEALTLAEGHDIALEVARARAALSAAWLAQGSVTPALAELHDVVADLQAMGNPIELVWVYGLAALAALADDDGQTARQSLRAALDVAEKVGSAQPLVAELANSLALTAFVEQHPTLADPLAAAIERLRSFQITSTPYVGAQPHFGNAMPFSLRVYTLGQERIELDGQTIKPSLWKSAAAKQLFFYLLFKGPTRREVISLDFWEDSPPQRVRSNFHTTLYRARQAVGEHLIVLDDELYQINPELTLWCDALVFTERVAQARLLSQRDARAENLWRKAVDLYHGDLLPSIDSTWVYQQRLNIQDYYLEALVGLGECRRARGDYRNAVGTFKRALRVDPYREDIYRSIFNCYAALGERHQVLTHWRTLEGVLREELAIEPSAETVALAQSLLS